MSELDSSTQSAPGGEAPPTQPPATPAEPVRRGPSRTGVFFLGAFAGCAVLVVGFFMLVAAGLALRGSGSGELAFGEKVAVVALEGEIVDSREVIDAIHKYAENSAVRALVIRINSPGGGVAPSQEIYSEIRKVRRKSGKPIVASIDSVGASGGYYVAAACDQIIANPGSITGSIGVILQFLEMKDLLAWAKVKPETITSGAMKAAGSPFQELTPAERQYLQGLVTQMHGQFVRAVAAGRAGKMSEAQVAALADGRVFTGEQALGLKLIDGLGNLQDAALVAAKLAGMRGEPALLYPRRREHTLLDLLTDSNETRSLIERVSSRRVPQFLYRW